MKKLFIFLGFIFLFSPIINQVYSQEQRKIDLSAFQIWSDPYNPSNSDCFGVRDCFPDQPTQHHLWYFTNKNQRIWDAERIKQWIDKAVDLGVFNAINFGDDAPTFQYYRFFEVGDRESCSDGEYNLACFDELGNHCSQYPEDEISISFQMREVKKETFPNSICADKDLNIDFQVPDGQGGKFVLETGWVTGTADKVQLFLDGQSLGSSGVFNTRADSGGLAINEFSIPEGSHSLTYRVGEGDGFGVDWILLRKPKCNQMSPGYCMFTQQGMRPDMMNQVMGEAFAYAHQKGLMVIVEPWVYPDTTNTSQVQTWVDNTFNYPQEKRIDFLVFSLDAFTPTDCSQDKLNAAEKMNIVMQEIRDQGYKVGFIVDLANLDRCFPSQDYEKFINSIRNEFPKTIFSYYGLDIFNYSQVELDLKNILGNKLMVQLNPTENGHGTEFGDDDHYWTNLPRTLSALNIIYSDSNYAYVSKLNIAGLNWGWEQSDVEEISSSLQPKVDLAEDKKGVLFECSYACDKKPQGDADCNNSVNLIDFAVWLKIFKTGGDEEEKATVNFDCQADDTRHAIDIADFRVWLDSFIASF